MSTPPFTFDIVTVETSEDVAAARRLILDYSTWLDVDLCFQGFEAEMAAFPAGYDVVLLAKVAGAPAGTVGLRRFEANTCEMKRLYVPEAFQGMGIGRALSEQIIEAARARNYRAMRLDTLTRLTAAMTLYRRLGFREIPAYYDNPMDEVVYWEKEL